MDISLSLSPSLFLFHSLHMCHGPFIRRIHGECLLISSLPGKASITLVDIARLPSDSTCLLEAEPGKLYIKRSEPDILFISSLNMT